MHTQAESTRTYRRAVSPGAIAGLTLYLLTLVGEGMLGGPVRWLLAYLGAATVGAIFPLGLSPEELAWLAALAPIAWSLTALALPGRGRMWARRIGARRPSVEEAVALDDAFALLRSADPSLPGPTVCHVLDDPIPDAAVRGRALILTRALLESESLAALLAHELGHAESLDGRLTEALDRLALWQDPLAPPRPEHGYPGPRDDLGGALTWALARWTLRLAGGSFAQRLLAPLWAAHWRSREYAADAYAASLGQAFDLARHLTDHELAFDAPQPRLLFKVSQHPPVALRIERLHARFEEKSK
jgi:Zn-dependent protease with chaperone function